MSVDAERFYVVPEGYQQEVIKTDTETLSGSAACKECIRVKKGGRDIDRTKAL